MTEVFGISNPELEAIRSVERYIATSIPRGEPFSPDRPVQDDLATVNRMLSRLVPAAPAEEVASRPNGNSKDSQGQSFVDRGSDEIMVRWAKEAIGLTAVELNEAYEEFEIGSDGGDIPSGKLCAAFYRLQEAMQRLGINTETDPIPF